MKLCNEVKGILDVACPMWMQKLCAINFDIQKLQRSNDRYLIESDYAQCFIGEIHHIDGEIDRYEDIFSTHLCKQCMHYAEVVPKIFTSKNANSPYGKNGLFSRKVRVGGKWIPISNNFKGRKQLLKLIADHVKEKHPELLNKKPIENDC